MLILVKGEKNTTTKTTFIFIQRLKAYTKAYSKRLKIIDLSLPFPPKYKQKKQHHHILGCVGPITKKGRLFFKTLIQMPLATNFVLNALL